MGEPLDTLRFGKAVERQNIVHAPAVENTYRNHQQRHIAGDLLLLLFGQLLNLHLLLSHHLHQIGDFHAHHMADLFQLGQVEITGAKQPFDTGLRQSQGCRHIAIFEFMRLEHRF